MRRLLLTATAALALAPAAHATGYYDEWGYHTDQPGDVCYGHDGVQGTSVKLNPDGVTWTMTVTCNDGHHEDVPYDGAYTGEGDGYTAASEYVPPPVDPDPWQQDYCVEPPERAL